MINVKEKSEIRISKSEKLSTPIRNFNFRTDQYYSTVEIGHLHDGLSNFEIRIRISKKRPLVLTGTRGPGFSTLS